MLQDRFNKIIFYINQGLRLKYNQCFSRSLRYSMRYLGCTDRFDGARELRLAYG